MKPFHKTWLAVLCGWLVLGTACKRAETPQPKPLAQPTPSLVNSSPVRPTAPPVEIQPPEEPQPNWRALLEQLGAPSLLTLQETNGRCEWSVLRPPQLEERLFLVTHICPNTLVWDRRGGRTLFALEGIPYLHDWQSARVEELEPPPIEQPEFGFSTTGVLRACEYQTQPDQSGTGAAFRTTLERQADGAWKKIAYEKIGYEATDQPCSGPVDIEMSGEMLYNPRHQATSNCPVVDRPPTAVCPSKESIEALAAQVKVQHDAFEYLAFSDQSFIAYPVNFGQSVTKLAPVFAIEADGVTEIYSRQPPTREYAVLLGTDYLLVRAAVEMTHATLFQKGLTEPVKEFPDETTVIWIPGTIPAADVIVLTPEVSGDEGEE